MAKRKSAKKPDVNQRINALESRMEELIDALEERSVVPNDVALQICVQDAASVDAFLTNSYWTLRWREIDTIVAQLTRHEDAWQKQVKLNQIDGQMQIKLATVIDDNNDTAIAEVGTLSSRIAALEQIAEKLKTLFPMTLGEHTLIAESLEASDVQTAAACPETEQAV